LYLVISIVSNSFCIQSYKYLFLRKSVNRLFPLIPRKKKHPQFIVVSTINRKNHELYRDTVAQRRQHRRISVILLRHIRRKVHKFGYTGRGVCPKSVVSRPENYGMESPVYCTLKSHNLQIPSLFPVIFDIN